MAIRNRQIGWSNKSNLLYDILRELDALKGQLAVPTTTTTTTQGLNLTLEINNSSNFNIPAYQPFTIEWFAKVSSDSNHPRHWSIGSWPSAAHAVSIENGMFYYWINGSIIAQANIVGYLNTWTHFCLIRSNIYNYLVFAVNGYIVGGAYYPDAISSQGKNLYIGSEGNDSVLNGLMSNFRWTNNQVYTNFPFTPPTAPLHNDPGTILNIFQGNTLNDEITDISGSGYTITNETGIYDVDNPFVGVEGSIKFGI